MKRNWDIDELIEHFTFLPNELALLSNKSGATRLGFAALFKFFQYEARFPKYMSEIGCFCPSPRKGILVLF